MSILFVDDSSEQRQIIETLLAKGGVLEKFVWAESADDAFAHLKVDDPQHESDVNLILLDILMPRTNGIEACRMIKSKDHLRDIPIIMFTGMSYIESLNIAFDAGAMDYIVKPAKRPELLARVRSALNLKNAIDLRKVRERELTREIEERKQAEQAREQVISELKAALAQVKTLQGLLPICAKCKKVRDDQGYWNQIETYLRKHADVDFSHSICPNCAHELYPDIKLSQSSSQS